MMYIQEYGLGRLIGPRPNWSGVYRSDEWLIEHFRQPSRHTPKSIMPVMPFDTSKFYALTYMLDMLAKKNRDSAREIWSHYGFNPEQAYQMYCSQCHGAFLHGNGPVAEWIYPIPKNLRNADFLRNYTKENIINSITHGVKGTPMPPWGEVALDKPMADGIPVLTKNEITQLVDWIFSSLLGSNINVNDENIPKWHYGAGDVIQELKTDVFDVSPNLNLSAEKNAYYIKKRFYTEDNLRAGKDFFDLNCAVCHGNEADGQGYRAGSMYDAKPRMLTNLHWAETRDDLRLLRSIKYGVPGTAMTPWGDLTNSLQRLQLVMYIRSLSLDQQQRDDLFNKLYQIFDAEEQVLDTARISEYQVINQLESQFDQLNNLRQTSLEHAKNGQIDSKQIALLYEQELDLTEKLKHHKEADHLLIELKNLVHEQGKIYQVLGMTLIGQTLMNESFKQYLHLIQVSAQDFKVVAGQLEAQFNDAKETELKGLAKELGASLEVQIQLFEKEKNIIGGKLPSQEKNVELDQIKTHIIGLKKVQQVLAESMTKSAHLRSEQKAIYEKYKKKLKELNYDKL